MKSLFIKRSLLGRLLVPALALVPAVFLPGSAPAQTALTTVTATTAVTISTNIPVPASGGTTYVLEKYSPGQLTIAGQITGGAGSLLETTTQTSGDTSTIFYFTATNAAYVGGIQTWRGVVVASNSLALGTGTIYLDANLSTNGDLTFGGNMTFTNPLVLQESETISSGGNSVTLLGGITDGGSGYGLTKYGPGTLTFAGTNTYGGTTSIGSSTGAGGTLALGKTNALPPGNPLIIDNRYGASVFSLGSYPQNIGAITLYAGNATRTVITGTGMLQLGGSLTLVDAHTSAQDYPLAFSAPLDLNGTTCTFTVGYGNNAESTDLGDLHLNGSITNSSGTAGLVLTNYSNGTAYNGSVTLGAANTYNGPTVLAGGTGNGTSTLALNANNALPNGSAFIQSANTILDLTAWGKTTGITTGLGSLTGSGKVILGSAGVLTLGYDNTSPAAYAGVITNSGGSLVKTGSGTFTLTGSIGSVAAGKTVVNGGTFLVNGTVAGGALNVANGGTLAGAGTITGFVTASNGATMTAGSGGSGTLTAGSLALGVTGTDAITLNCSASSASGITALFNVTGSGTFTNNGIVTFNVAGTVPATVPASYNLLTYSGTMKGAGTFVTGRVPGLGGYITNNASASAIQLVIPPLNVAPVTWAGVPTNNWDLSGSNVWVQTGTATPVPFTNGEAVVFSDTASNFTVNLAALVSPASILVTNSLNNYIITGAGSISNSATLPASLTKQGTATLTLATANAYTGNTTVGAGTLVLGAVGALPGWSVTGSVQDNGTLDLGGYSPKVSNLTGSGVVDNISAGGSPVLWVSNTVNTVFTGVIQNSSGSLALNLSGTGGLTLPGNNAYSGGTTIAGGALTIQTGGGAGGGPVTVTENLAGGTAAFLNVATNTAVIFSNNIVLPNNSGTYAVSKAAGGQLTLAGTLSGGGTGLTLQTTTGTPGDNTTPFEFSGTNSAFTGNFQTYRGSVLVDNASALGAGTIFGDGGNGTAGDLCFNANMTFPNALVIQSATSLSSGTNIVTLTGNISGTGALTKYGTGTLNLTGNFGYNGGLVAGAGTLGIGSILLAGDTTSGGGLGATYTNYISIAAGATVQSYGTLTLYESSTLNPYIGVSGAGTLLLAGTTNSANSPDISFAANDTTVNGTANWGDRISAPINLGGAQRYIWGRTDHTSVDAYNLQEADCQFDGPISGSGGLTFIAQSSSSGSSGTPMETPFCLNATNTFAGPVQIQRGSVYLGTNNAFPAGDVLTFNVASGNNGKLFLYGHNTTVANLSSTGAGTALIANGNRNPSAVGPATLTITMNTPGTYSGIITDTNVEYAGSSTGAVTTLSLVKTGPAALTLNGPVAFSGPLTVNAGYLYLDTNATGGGAVSVATGGTLAGNGIISSAVTVSNGAAIEAGGGTGLGTLSVNSLALGVTGADNLTLNIEAVPSGLNSINVSNANGLTNNGTVTVNITGVMPGASPIVYNLITYSGSLKGSGSFVLGAMPDAAVAYLTNNLSASAVQLVVSSVTIPSVTWVGAPTNGWDLLGSNVWTVTGSNLPAAFVNEDTAVFDDTASNYTVNLDAVVSPDGLLVTNNANNYTIGGNGAIAGYTGLTKAGAGSLTLASSNSYSGPTVISGGTLSIGTAGAVPGGPGAGNVTVNGTLDVGGQSPTLNNLAGSGTVDDLSAGGSPVVTVAGSATNNFSGVIQNTSGSLELNYNGTGTLILSGSNTYSGVTTVSSGRLQFGAGGASGQPGGGSVLDMAALAFDRSDNYTNQNNIAGTGSLQNNGPGTVTLAGNLTYAGPTLANAGTLVFPHDVTFDAGAGSTLTVASNAVAETGFEIFLNANSSSVAVDINGAGITRLISTLNRIESYADVIIGANNNGVSTANYGIRIASGLDLGSTERLFWAYSSRDDVSTFGLTGCDCQFAGPLYGTAQLILLGQNSWQGVNTMEEQFALNASNSWTGTLEVRRGSVYLGNANALTQTNGLILDPAASVNSRFFLYGYNAVVSDLQSGGYGSTVIADGNNVTSSNAGPATLTVIENDATTFAGNIVDWYTEYAAPNTGPLSPTLSLIKSGAATLTLTGSNTYSGTTVISAGGLVVNGTSTGGGAVTVATNAFLGGAGLITSAVTVQNGGTIQTGGGNLTLRSLTLGSAAGNAATLDLTPSVLLAVTNNNGLVLNGGANSVTVNISSGITSLGAVPLISYAGTLGGTGFAAFQLGALPPGVLGHLSNDTAHAYIDFVATQVTTPRWTGVVSSQWNTNVLASPKNWVLNADGVTPEDYVDGENVIFDDTATNTSVIISPANVFPGLVEFTNSAKTYAVTGVDGIAGTASLLKSGAGKVTLGTTNTYTGATTVSSGTLALGTVAAIPGGTGAGNVTVNGTLDLAGFSPVLNNLSGTGVVDDVSAGGSPVLTVATAGNPTFGGVIKNTTGSVGLTVAGTGTWTLTGSNTFSGPTVISGGVLNVNGSLAGGGLTAQSGTALGGTGKINGHVTLASGSALDLTANAPLTAGALTVSGAVTVNAGGTITTSNSATYVLFNYASLNATNLFSLAAVPGILNSGYTASLNVTTNQLQLVIAPVKPTGTIADVRHVVIFMQENRSFDHYFGSLHGVHGYGDHVTLTLTNGNSVLYQPSGSGYELPFHSTIQCLSDLDHSWGATHNAINSGWNNGWVSAKGTETMAFYNRSDIPYYYALADNFTICDEYHCSILTSTDPNRVFFMTGWNDPDDLGGGPLIDNTEPSAGWGTNWVTYPEMLQKAGVSWKIYQASDNYDDNALNWFAAYKNAATGTPLYNNGEVFAPSIQSGSGFPADLTNLVSEFKNAVISNTLPSVSWIIGPDVGSEHPSWSPEDGEILTKGLLDALASNPSVYNSTVFILNYDENDGFYDHAVPINPPAGTTNEFNGGLPYGLGIRVPCIIISPWSTGGYVCSQVFDHTSVIRFLEKWTGVKDPNISAWRRQVCGDLTSAFNFTQLNTNYPGALTLATENDCASGSTASPPGTQTVPTQESGTLLERPLPYQPNATPMLNAGANTFSINLTNSGAAAMHFTIYANAYSAIAPLPYDVNSSNAASSSFSTSGTGGNYDFSCYSANGFLRRFAGNMTADAGKIESVSYLNPTADGVKITLANPGTTSVTFSVTNGWFANSLATYTVPAGSTNVVFLDASTNNGWYDLKVTASSDSLFVRRFAGHLETNVPPDGLSSSENPSGFKDMVTFTANFAGYGTPTGTAQFMTNGVALGTPVALVNGTASISTALLPRTNNLVTVAYSGDILNDPATNSLTQTVLNHPPVPATVLYQREAGQPLTIPISDLLTNVTDVDGDPITLVGVGTDGYNLSTTNGVTLGTNATSITYTNSVTTNATDTFEYTVSDGQGGISLGTVIIVVDTNYVAPTNLVATLIVSTTNTTVNFFGAPGSQYEVDRSTNLTPGVGLGWVPISTNVAPPSGIIQVNDTFQNLGIEPPVPPAAFYRLRPNNP